MLLPQRSLLKYSKQIRRAVSMSLYLDNKYLNLLKPRLSHFKQVDKDTYCCRCTVCGDSKKDQSKTRMYFFTKQNAIRVYCHNCGYSSSFLNYLKYTDQQLYKQYLFDVLQDKKIERQLQQQAVQTRINNTLRATKTITTSEHIVDDVLTGAIRVDLLDDNHPCKQYVISRLIPKDKVQLLYYVDDFKRFVNQIIPGKFKSGKTYFCDKEPRLIIPYFNNHGKCFMFQGRALDPANPIRYFSIKIDQDAPTVYGLDRIDYSKQIYCTEGPIDSLFLPNCLAVSGSCYHDGVIEQLKSNIIIVPDNERRNASVTKQIGSMIDQGYKVCLWPDNLNFKDINEAIIKGWDPKQLVEIINNTVVQGLSGKVKFKLWKR